MGPWTVLSAGFETGFIAWRFPQQSFRLVRTGGESPGGEIFQTPGRSANKKPIARFQGAHSGKFFSQAGSTLRGTASPFAGLSGIFTT